MVATCASPEMLICRFWPIFVVEATAIRVYVIFITFLILAEDRLSIIDAALIGTIHDLFMEEFLTINTLSAKCRRGMEDIRLRLILLATI